MLREWQYTDGSRSLHSRNTSNSQHSLLGSSTFHSPTSRKLKITVVEGSNLAGKDRSRKSDPYVKLQYGKVGFPNFWVRYFSFSRIRLIYILVDIYNVSCIYTLQLVSINFFKYNHRTFVEQDQFHNVSAPYGTKNLSLMRLNVTSIWN